MAETSTVPRVSAFRATESERQMMLGFRYSHQRLEVQSSLTSSSTEINLKAKWFGFDYQPSGLRLTYMGAAAATLPGLQKPQLVIITISAYRFPNNKDNLFSPCLVRRGILFW